MSSAIRVAIASDGDHFLMVRGQRAVTILVAYVGDMLGEPDAKAIKMGDVRRIAEVIFENPARVGGRVLYCPEQFDTDRKCQMDLYRIDGSGKLVQCGPLCGKCGKEKRKLEWGGGWSWWCKSCDAKLQPGTGDGPSGGAIQGDGYQGTEYGDDAEGWKKDPERGG